MKVSEPCFLLSTWDWWQLNYYHVWGLSFLWNRGLRAGGKVADRGRATTGVIVLFLWDNFPANYVRHPTAGLPIRCTNGLRWHFCCRGPISNPRSLLDFPAQTTRGELFDFFVRCENELVTLVFGKRVFSQGFFKDKIGPLSSNQFFSQSEAYYECKSM